MHRSPSKWADKILGWFLKGHLLEEVLGDLHEYYQELAEHPGWKRSLLYWFQCLHFLRPILIKNLFRQKTYNHLSMINFNFRIATRSLVKNKLITIAGLLTLVFGTTCFHLIYRWIDNELAMDAFHSNFNRIYMGAVQTNPTADFSPISPQMMFRLDYDQFSEIEKSLLIHIYDNNEIKVSESGRDFFGKAFIADSTFFSFFNFPIKQGTSDGLLHDPTHIVLSGNFARRVFGDVDPIGKTIEVKCDQQGLYTVVAVTEFIPSNSSIEFDFIIPRHSQRFWRRIPMDLLLVNEGFDPDSFNEKIAYLGRENNTRFPESIITMLPINSAYFDHPLDVALFGKAGDRKTVDTMLFIGAVICLITFLGFNNLQSTKQLSMADKMGIKQVIGSSKWFLCVEMITERILYLLLASALSFFLFESIFPYYQTILTIDLGNRPIFDLICILGVIGGIILLSILVSIIQIYRIEVKGTLIGTKNLFKIPRMQRSITIIQYAATIALLIATTIVFIQYKFMTTKSPGFDHQNIVSVDFFEIASTNDQNKSVELIKNRLAANPSVVTYAQGDLPVNSEAFLSSWKQSGLLNKYESRKVMIVSPGYLDLLGIDLLEGRFFSDSLDQSGDQKVVINEAAKKYFGIEHISQASLSSNTSGRQEMDFEIIGVVENFHFEDLSQKIQPLILRYRTYTDDNFLVRFNEGQLVEGIEFLEKLNEEVNPGSPFNYDLLSDRISMQYQKEKQLGKVYTALSIVGLILSSISLFTFSFYETKRRTKEIGIRKVNGATDLNIFRLLTSSFLKTVVVAFVIAVPIAWFFSNQWIQEFAYRAEIGWWVFVATGIVTLLIALLAVLFHVKTLSQQNPVESLRYE